MEMQNNTYFVFLFFFSSYIETKHGKNFNATRIMRAFLNGVPRSLNFAWPDVHQVVEVMEVFDAGHVLCVRARWNCSRLSMVNDEDELAHHGHANH